MLDIIFKEAFGKSLDEIPEKKLDQARRISARQLKLALDRAFQLGQKSHHES